MKQKKFSNSTKICPHYPIGSNIYELLYNHLDDATNALENELSVVTIADLISELFQKIQNLPIPPDKTELS